MVCIQADNSDQSQTGQNGGRADPSASRNWLVSKYCDPHKLLWLETINKYDEKDNLTAALSKYDFYS